MSREDNNHHRRYVTNAELERKLDEKPSRWEVRFLVLAGFIGSQVVASVNPVERAEAAIRLLF